MLLVRLCKGNRVSQRAAFMVSCMLRPLALQCDVGADLLLCAEYFIMSMHADAKTFLVHLEMLSLETGLYGFT